MSSFPSSDSTNTAGNAFVYRTIAVTAQGLTFQDAPSGFNPDSTKLTEKSIMLCVFITVC